MRKRWLLPIVLVLGCRSGPTIRNVPMIPADVGAVDGGALVVVGSSGEVEEAIEEGGELPGGDEAVGKRAPGFTLDSVVQKGGRVRLLRNKVTVIHFWATWCEPCRHAFVMLDKIHEQYVRRGVSVIGISVDDEDENLLEWAQSFQTRFAVVWDSEKKITNRYKPQTMPSTFVVDRSGVVRKVMNGYHEGDGATLEDVIRSLL